MKGVISMVSNMILIILLVLVVGLVTIIGGAFKVIAKVTTRIITGIKNIFRMKKA